MKYTHIKQFWKQLRQNRFFTFLSLFGVAIPMMIIMLMILKVELFIHPGGPEKNNDQMLFLNRSKVKSDNGESWGGLNLGILENYFSQVAPSGSMAFSRLTGTTFFLNNETMDAVLRYTNADFWKVYDFPFLEGRGFTGKNLRDKDNVVVISRYLSRKLLGKDSGVGETLEIDGETYRIIGIVKNVTSLARNTYAHAWLPYTLKREVPVSEQEIASSTGAYSVAFRATEQWGFDQIRKDVEMIRTKLNRISSESTSLIFGGPADATDIYFRGIRDPEVYEGKLWNYLAIAGKALMILFLPALNLVSLNLTRIQERSHEIAIRKAFGGTRRQMTWQIMLENSLLTILGGMIGLLLAYGVAHAFREQVFSEFFILHADHVKIQMNYLVFLIVILVSLLFSILSGLIPSWRISRLKPAYVLKGGEL